MDIIKIEINDIEDNNEGSDELITHNTDCTIDLTADEPQNDDIEIVNVISPQPSIISESLTINDDDSIATQPAYDYSSTEFDGIDVVEEIVSAISPNSTHPGTSSVPLLRPNRVRRSRRRRLGGVAEHVDATVRGENLVGEMRLSEPPQWMIEPSDTEAAEYSDSNDSDAILYMGEHYIPSVSVYDFQLRPRRRPIRNSTLSGNSLKRFRRRFNERNDLPRKRSTKSEEPVNTNFSYDPSTGCLRLPVCPICQENLTEILSSKRQLLSTICGHLFCSDCLPTYCAIPPKPGTQLRCPVCSASLSQDCPYHNLYW